MSRSTFNGPVLVGVDEDEFHAYGDGTLTEGPNWGFANMSQSAAIEQTSTVLYPVDDTNFTMVIPAKSTITRISILVTTTWTQPLDIGQAWGTGGSEIDLDDLVADVVLTALGTVVAGPSDTDISTDIENWMNNSSKESPDGDRCIAIRTPAGGSAGRGVLTVNYCQAVDLTAIA